MANLGHRLRYLFLESGQRDRPLFEAYFVRMTTAGPDVFCACNGWTVGGGVDDHASQASAAYVRRDVIVWSDLVKLRYGNGPAACPVLWSTMEAYTRQTATVFDALRVDNAHSTPAHVAAHMLRVARAANARIYVVAELFTGSDELDAHYLSSVGGIHAIVVEAMRAKDARDLSRLVYRFGGGERRPVGSLTVPPQLLRPTVPAALFMDCSHDNRTPAQDRHLGDTLSNAACVWASNCAVGSTWGLDELVPYNVSVADERRLYALVAGGTSGIGAAKARLGELHESLVRRGFSETHVHQQGNLIVTQRHNPVTHEAFFVVAHMCFDEPTDATPSTHTVAMPHNVQLQLEVAWALRTHATWRDGYIGDGPYICGVEEGAKLEEIDERRAHDVMYFDGAVLHLRNFPAGAVAVLRSHLAPEAALALKELLSLLATGPHEALTDCSLLDLNVVLYRCEAEEQATTSTGCYVVPALGPANFCGLAGVLWLLETRASDLGSPLFDNLRSGDWLMSYCWERLERHAHVTPNVLPMAAWLKHATALCGRLPRHLIPRYFAQLVHTLHAACVARCAELMSPFVREQGGFVLQLALGGVQMHGHCPGADILNVIGGVSWRGSRATMAAGLPWFSSGYMRCWGRDTCIALRGLYLVTGRFDEARELLRVFAATVRNGVVPNLLDGAANPRYNARDATWWFLQALQDTWRFDREATSAFLLKARVPRLYPNQHGPKAAYTTIADIVQEVRYD